MRLLTENIQKGYSAFNHRSVLHGLRDAVRRVRAGVVMLQEVEGVSRRATHAAAPSVGAPPRRALRRGPPMGG